MEDVIGVDLGATRVRVALVDKRGISASISEMTDKQHGPEGITNQIARMIGTLLSERVPEAKPRAIGIGSIGPVDLSSGCVIESPNIPFKRIRLVDSLSEAFAIPVYLANDCNAAALGEHVFGAGVGRENLVYVTISTGIGGGAIVDGHLLMGKDGNAVEIGHITVDSEGAMACGCGCRGHWEAYCSGENIPRYARHLLIRREPPEVDSSLLLSLSGGEAEKIDAKKVFDAAKMGDNLSRWILEKIGSLNAIGFADLVNVFDPELITVGGSVALNNPDLILNPVVENIGKHTINRVPEIRVTPLGDEVVLYGAAAFAQQRLLQEKKRKRQLRRLSIRAEA